jgi:hypothetical protein
MESVFASEHGNIRIAHAHYITALQCTREKKGSFSIRFVSGCNDESVTSTVRGADADLATRLKKNSFRCYEQISAIAAG